MLNVHANINARASGLVIMDPITAESAFTSVATTYERYKEYRYKCAFEYIAEFHYRFFEKFYPS